MRKLFTRKLFTLGALALMMSLSVLMAAAQGGRPGGGPPNPQMMQKRMKEMRDKMVKDLGLNASQTKKFDALTKHSSAEMMKMFSSPGDFKSKRPMMMKIRDERNAELKKILTPAQWAKYQKMEADMRARRGGPGGARPGPGRPGGAKA